VLLLFALCTDGVISELKLSGHGVHVGSLFIGCVVYADECHSIVLLSAFCDSLQPLASICNVYGAKWDIKFNPLKSQLIAFGDQNHCGQIMLNGKQIPRVNKVKYLGIHLCCDNWHHRSIRYLQKVLWTV